MHLLSAATLYLSIIGFITLWWQIINFLFPDKLNAANGFGSSIYNSLIWGTSALVVSFPVYVLVSWIIGRDFKIYPLKREASVRKWLWYITLFVSAMTIIIDLVTLVFNFLKGDLTIQFFLKLIVILAVAAAVFGYYLWDLRKRENISDAPKKMTWAAGAVILASIIYGFFLVGSPAKQRDLRFDEQRVSSLQQIQNSAVEYWQQKNQLPQNLEEMNKLGYGTPTDPETGKQYEYSATSEISFRLCADFKAAFKTENNNANTLYYYSPRGIATIPQNWVHDAGQTCFDSTIDKDFYKVQTNSGLTPVVAPVKD
ncbi:MAG: DUF5671 domain-containing protein [Candidatus Paceibacterota bacterium]